nr:hypothetical protein CFP56_74397 [Quercus suber]
MEIRKVSAELFEEQIQEIDRDIHKYDPLPELITKNIACTGKENDFESLTINEIFEMGRSQARGQPLYQPTRTPFSQIPDATNVPVINTATWKRQNRITTGTDVIMEDTVGSKRKNRDPALFSVVVWALWNRRNNLRLGKTCGTLRQLLSQANDRLKEFSLHNTVMTSTERRTPILEIDSVLNGFEISENTERGEAAKNKEVHVENPNIDASNKLPVSLESGLDASVGHVEKGMEAGAGHVEILNSKYAEPNRERRTRSAGWGF